MPLLAAAVAAVALLSGPVAEQEPASPGDGLGLAPQPIAVSPVGLPEVPSDDLALSQASAGRHAHDPRPHPGPWVPVPLGVAAAVGAAFSTPRRAHRADEPLYFLVHGNGGSADDFDPLLDLMGVDRRRVVAFDYRSVAPGASSTAVSRWVDTNEVAREIDAQLRDLAENHAVIYSIHHSKGAAAGVMAIAAIDDGTRPPIDGYRGAALLDPPIAAPPLGVLQRLGQPFGWAPDNGGFNPIRCDDEGCRDIREHLGRSAGVEVIAVRNPDAELTNFRDHPDGLRVYDLEHDGDASAWAYWWNPVAMVRRMFEAHTSVLAHRSVAECIGAEVVAPGTCRWNRAPRRRRWPWGSGGGIPPTR